MITPEDTLKDINRACRNPMFSNIGELIKEINDTEKPHN